MSEGFKETENSEIEHWIKRKQKDLETLQAKIGELESKESRTDEESTELESLKHKEGLLTQEIDGLQGSVDGQK